MGFSEHNSAQSKKKSGGELNMVFSTQILGGGGGHEECGGTFFDHYQTVPKLDAKSHGKPDFFGPLSNWRQHHGDTLSLLDHLKWSKKVFT